MILTIAEICDLAAFAGLVIKDGCEPDADELETEITIAGCTEGVRDDDGTVRHYAHIASLSEYPEEGVMGLGPEIAKEQSHASE